MFTCFVVFTFLRTANMAYWNEERSLQLIEAYRNTTLLWDRNHKHYYKKILKEAAWSHLGAILNTSGAVCKQKMSCVLASYRRERMKAKKCAENAKGGDDMYISSWYAYDALSFLDDRNAPLKALAAKRNIISRANLVNNIVFAAPPLSTEKPKPNPQPEIIKDAVGISKNAPDNPPQSKQNPELKAFFDFVSEKMKQYSKETKNSVQHEIFQIIMRADQGYYDNLQQQNGYVSSQVYPQPTTISPTPSTSMCTSEEEIKCEEI